jgi:signal transduction histidine kinase
VLLSLINDVLNFAKLDAGQVELHVSDTPVADILRDVEQLMAPQLAAKRLAYDFSSDNCARVHADAEKTQQILLNLISNAIKFTDEGGEVSVKCDSAGDTVRFEVKDSGVGIALDKQSAIFEPFVQLDRTLRSGHHGVGLGLAISRDLANAMDGQLVVESAPGEGARFVLTLPEGRAT